MPVVYILLFSVGENTLGSDAGKQRQINHNLFRRRS